MKNLIALLVCTLTFQTVLAAPNPKKKAGPTTPASKPPAAPAKPMECMMSEGPRSMVFRAGKGKEAAMLFREGNSEVSCPYLRTKVESTRPKTGRLIKGFYKSSGPCLPKGVAAKPSRPEIMMVVEFKNGKPHGRFEDAKIKAAAPCALTDFHLNAFGLTK